MVQSSEMVEVVTQDQYRSALSDMVQGIHEGPPERCAAAQRWLGNYQLFQNSVTEEMIRAPEGTIHPDTLEPLDTYLSKHDREDKNDFAIRKGRAFYLGVPGEVIDSYLGAIFHQEVNRDLVTDHFGEDLGKALLGNVDGQGHGIRWWMRNEAARIALRDGWCGVLVDILPIGEREPRLPYARAIDPTRLWDWDVDSLTGLFRYALIQEDSERWRAWYPTHSELLDQNGELLAEPIIHDFGVVPLFIVVNTPGSSTGSPLPFGLSLIRGVARVARKILDLCSQLDSNETKALFSQLHLKVDAPKKKVSAEGIIGGENYYLMTSADAEWLASPVEIPTAFREQIMFWVEMAWRISGIWTGVEKLQEQHSGTALAWWFSDKVLRVRTKIEELEAGENRLWSWFSFMLGLGENGSVGPEALQLVQYPPDYSVVPVGEELEESKVILDLAGKLESYGEEAKPLRSALLEWFAIKIKRSISRDAGNAPESAPLIERLSRWLKRIQYYELGATPAPASTPTPMVTSEMEMETENAG